MAGSARIDELKKKFDENPGRYFAPLANEYRKAGEIDQAISICRTYLAEKPGHMSGLIVFGQALFEAKQYDEARSTFEQALALDPENLIALRHLGDIARDVGDPRAARGWYQRVLDADPRNEEIAAQLALVADAAASTPEPAPAPAATSSGMSGWGDINPETPSGDIAAVSSASTLVMEPVRPPEASITTEEPPRISLQMPSFDDPTVSTGIEREETMGLEPTSFGGATIASGGSLGIERTQEFDIAGGDVSSGGIELDRPFEMPQELPAVPTSELGLEVSEFTPPPPDETPPPESRISLQFEPADDIMGVSAPAPRRETQPATERDVPEAIPPATPEPAAESSAPPAPGFVTETMAELYLKQGYRAEAIDVYRKLVEQNPGDATLRDKLRSIEEGQMASDVRAVTSEAAAAATAGAEAEPWPGSPSTKPSSGRSARSFFGSLAGRRAPRRSADAYASMSETATETGGVSPSGVTGPSDWIMEPAPPTDTSAPGATAPPAPAAAAAEEEVASPSSSPVATDADAFGSSESEWPEVTPSAEPWSAPPAAETGWGIGPVTEPQREPAVSGQSLTPPAAETAFPAAPGVPEATRTPRTPPRGSGTFRAISELEPAPPGIEDRESAVAPAASSLDILFGGASVKSADHEAASTLAGAFAPPAAPPPATTPSSGSSAPQQRGQPARAASSELSLDHVFRESPRKSGAVRQTGGFSFDQFFSDKAVANPASPETASEGSQTPAPGAPTSEDDVGQFNSWLQGLKKK